MGIKRHTTRTLSLSISIYLHPSPSIYLYLDVLVEAVVHVRVGHIDDLLPLGTRAREPLADVDNYRRRVVGHQRVHDALSRGQGKKVEALR